MERIEYIEKLEHIIDTKFPLIRSLSILHPVYFLGGGVRDTILGNEPKDLDFVCLSDSDDLIINFINKFNLTYTHNRFGGYKVSYNGMNIDIWNTNDLLSAVEYNIDGLFYDIRNKMIIPFGFFDALNNGIRKIGNPIDHEITEKDVVRTKKLNLFINDFNKKNKCFL